LTCAVALTAFAVVVPTAPADAAKRRVAKRQLTAFRSCDGLVAFAQRRVRRFGSDVFTPRRGVAIDAAMPAPATGGPQAGRDMASAEGAPAAAPSAPVAGSDFSGTNVQEKDVDEPDAVKTDGRRLYVAMADKLYALDVTGDAPKLVGTLALKGYSHELLLRDGKLLVISTGGFDGPFPTPMPMPSQTASGEPAPARAADVIYPSYAPETVLTEVSTAGDSLTVLNTLTVPGTIVGGRLRDGTARIAIASQTGFPPAEGAPPVRRWVPAMELRREATGRVLRRSVAPCAAVRRPEVFAGLGLLSVLTIDLDRGLNPVDADAILADASTVYASKSRMYFATERWVDPDVIAEDGAPAGRSTQIHAFDVGDDDATRYVGGGNVRGYLLNQFSLSEHKGALRVATTEDPPWFLDMPRPVNEQQSESFVTVLDETAGRLAQVGRVGGLGKGERIYAVRFVEDIGFVVTFRQTDPLYTLDLSDRTAPRVVGELKIPGFSSYLHPIGDDLMLGIGQDADGGGRTRGAQVSLFDVGDLANPRRLSAKSLGPYAYSAAESDHHAFLWWAPTKLLVVPVSDYGERGENPFVGAVGLHADRTGLAEAGRTEHPEQEGGWTPDIYRSVVVGDRLFTISSLGIQAGRLDTLAGTAWVPFPTSSR
ncbi:MAG TPA: beta-propeller domain-containing protein, partial [Solirubrobacteraceae bacterium]